MSVAGQPDPRPAANAVRWLRWALVTSVLALVIVLALLAAALINLRQETRSSPKRLPGGVPERPARAPAAGPHRSGGSRVAASALLARRRSARHRHRPLVQIVERPVNAAPEVPRARAPVPARPSVPVPRQRLLGAQWNLPPSVASAPVPAARPPHAVLPEARPSDPDPVNETRPVPIARPPADYPEAAAAEGVTGSVRLKVVVDRRGRVEDAIVVRSSGDERLDAAADSAVRRWRYRPARRAGRAVMAVDYVVVEFYRQESAPGLRE